MHSWEGSFIFCFCFADIVLVLEPGFGAVSENK